MNSTVLILALFIHEFLLNKFTETEKINLCSELDEDLHCTCINVARFNFVEKNLAYTEYSVYIQNIKLFC